MKVNKEIRRIELDKRKRIEKMRYVKVENLGKMLIYKINFPAYIYIYFLEVTIYLRYYAWKCAFLEIVKNKFILLHTYPYRALWWRWKWSASYESYVKFTVRVNSVQ